MDEFGTGLVKTHNANTPIADSAPAGTAMATGYKSESPYVGVYPTHQGLPGTRERADYGKKPLTNPVEAAERLGKSTGLVVTCNIQHATPADFSAHHPNRNDYSALGEQQVYQGMEVVLGAGSKYLLPEGRTDKEDLVAEIKNLGYDYVTTPEAMKASTADKLWGMFHPTALANHWDRDPAKEPSLAEMTDKALSILSKNDKGFFLMVEGSKVDWSAHSNDPVGIVSEILGFDEAVGVALNFAKNNPDTVLLVASDHGNSGITIGNKHTTKGYDKVPLETFTGIITNAKFTGEVAAAKLNEDKSNIAAVAKEGYGIDLDQKEIDYIKNEKDPVTGFGHVIAERSGIGFTTGGHTGGDVALYCYSSGSVRPLTGIVNNSDIGQYVEAIMGADYDALTEKLFVTARPALEAKGATVEFNYNNGNPIIVATKGDTKVEYPTFKNYALVNGEKVMMDGITIMNDSMTFIPQSGIDLFK